MFVTNIISIQRAFRQRIAQIAIVAMGILPAPLFAAEASAENTKPIEARKGSKRAARCVRLSALVSGKRIRPILLCSAAQGEESRERATPTICPTTSASIYRRTGFVRAEPPGYVYTTNRRSSVAQLDKR